MWRKNKLGEEPEHTWQEAVVKWQKQASHKRSLNRDKFNLKWLSPYLINKRLSEIDNQMIESLATIKEKEGVTSATVNRLLALIRSILRKAERNWKWINKAPIVSIRYEGEKQERWLTHEEAKSLLRELPAHLTDMAAFSLATGLRQSNVRELCSGY